MEEMIITVGKQALAAMLLIHVLIIGIATYRNSKAKRK